MNRLHTCYLYEFLVAVTVITLGFQIIGMMDTMKVKTQTSHIEHNEVGHLSPEERWGSDRRDFDDLLTHTQAANISRAVSRTYFCNNESTGSFNILVFGGIKVIRQWQELNVLVNNFKAVDKTSHSLHVTCPYLRTTPDVVLDEGGTDIPCESNVRVVLSSNMNELTGKDIIVLGMSPYSLKIKTKVMRSKTSTNQLFVFYGVETPLRMREWIPDIGRQPVHAVWSYLESSDTVIPYGRYRKFPDGKSKRIAMETITGNKSKLIAWMGSNCVKQVFWPRMGLIYELQKYIQVDTYGKCGNLSCLPRMSEKCQHLMGEYKFYLSLENAECSDYMTEKFWDTGLIQGAVPVVYGAKKEDYERLAPPRSFIHVSDFESIESLANYLLLLDRNDILYQKYFEWRKHGEIEMVFPPLVPSSFCDVIKQYHLLKRGLLTAKELSETTWYQGCRLEAASVHHEHDFETWRPWK